VCERTQKEKYDAYRALASMIGVSPSTIKYQNIGKYLPGTDAEFLLDFARSPSLEGYFEVASEVSEFAREYVAFSQARKDESVLLRINPLAERMYPIFECFGTVTGRIIVLNPALQALRRRHRQIIKSDEGKKLLYLDYAQFEPGILAYVSGDRAFIDAYNTHDLYVELSRTLFGSSSKRSEAKRIFLAYSYGMSTSSIARLLRGNRASAAEIEVEKNKIASFFSNYPGLSRLRESLLDELQNTGSISSLMGNHRRRVIKGRLTTKEQNWALSQKIQGTASLIFKDALIALSNTYGADSILLPMHDAVLLQVPENEDLKKELAAIMAASFDKWCPGISVRITSENFASKAH